MTPLEHRALTLSPFPVSCDGAFDAAPVSSCRLACRPALRAQWLQAVSVALSSASIFQECGASVFTIPSYFSGFVCVPGRAELNTSGYHAKLYSVNQTTVTAGHAITAHDGLNPFAVLDDYIEALHD